MINDTFTINSDTKKRNSNRKMEHKGQYSDWDYTTMCIQTVWDYTSMGIYTE